MREIELTNGQSTLVDDADYEWLMQWKWHTNSRGYVVRSDYQGKKDGKYVTRHPLMHRVIMNTPIGLFTDHKDGNPLNNQRNNLRICTPRENAFNAGKRKDNTSGYKGVKWHKANKKWECRIRVDRKLIALGCFTCRHEAAKAYNAAALIHHGEFARLNEIQELS